MLTYLRGLNRSSMSEPELRFDFDWVRRNKVSSRTYLCRYSKWRLRHSVSFYTELVPWPTDSTEHVPRPHTHTQRNHSPSLLLTHTMLLLHTKQAGGGSGEGDRLWLSGGPVKGAPNQQQHTIAPVYPLQHLISLKYPLSSPRAPNAPHYWSITWLW